MSTKTIALPALALALALALHMSESSAGPSSHDSAASRVLAPVETAHTFAQVRNDNGVTTLLVVALSGASVTAVDLSELAGLNSADAFDVINRFSTAQLDALARQQARTQMHPLARLLPGYFALLPAEAERPLARIESTVGNLTEIMSALLFLSREDDLSRPLESTRLDELTAALVEDHAHLLRGTGGAFMIDESHPVVLTCPEAMVRIVISNLLRNAAEHGSDGPIRISLTADRLSISNTNGEFDAVAAARRYTEALSDSSKQGAGQGLGLFITRRICERFGWTLQIAPAAANETVAHLSFVQGS